MNAPLMNNRMAKPHYQFFNEGPAASGRPGQKQRVSFILAEDKATPFGKPGDLITLDLAPADVHDPAELPTYLAGYKVQGLVADVVSEILLTDAFSDKYRSFTDDNAFVAIDVKTGLESKVPEVDPETKLDTFTVIERAAGSFIPDRIASQSRYDVRRAAMKRVARALMLDREIDVQTLLTTTNNWNANNTATLGATTKWNGGSASDPIKDIDDRVEASAQLIDKILMARPAANAFRRHPAVKDYMRLYLGDSIAESRLARRDTFDIPGLPPIIITDCKHKTVKGGTLAYTWGNDVVLVTAPPGMPTDGEEIATSYTWRQRGPSGTGFITREFRVEDRSSLGGVFVVAAMAEVAVMPGPNCGGVIKSVIQ